MAFIVASRADVPALLKAYQVAAAEVELYKAALAAICAAYPDAIDIARKIMDAAAQR